MIPADDQLILFHSIVTLVVVHHILHRLIPRIHSRLGSLDGQRKGIHDVERAIPDFTIHEAHDFVLPAGTGVDDHLDQCDGRDFYGLKVVRTVSVEGACQCCIDQKVKELTLMPTALP